MFIGGIIVRKICIKVGWRICRGVLIEKVPCSKDTISYDRRLDRRIDDLWKEDDIPISFILDSGMVPLLTYAVRLPPKKEELDPGSIIPGSDICLSETRTHERTMDCIKTGSGMGETHIEASYSRHCRLLSLAQ